MMKKANNDIATMIENCANLLSVPELSRLTGIRIDLLHRYLRRRTRVAREETWDLFYPVLKPYLAGPEPEPVPPPRVGDGYRRHADLVEMMSDQKVLLDVFNIFAPSKRREIVKKLCRRSGSSEPTKYESLTPEENKLMGAFLHLPAEEQTAFLEELTVEGTREAKHLRSELF